MVHIEIETIVNKVIETGVDGGQSEKMIVEWDNEKYIRIIPQKVLMINSKITYIMQYMRMNHLVIEMI